MSSLQDHHYLGAQLPSQGPFPHLSTRLAFLPTLPTSYEVNLYWANVERIHKYYKILLKGLLFNFTYTIYMIHGYVEK